MDSNILFAESVRRFAQLHVLRRAHNPRSPFDNWDRQTAEIRTVDLAD